MPLYCIVEHAEIGNTFTHGPFPNRAAAFAYAKVLAAEELTRGKEGDDGGTNVWEARDDGECLSYAWVQYTWKHEGDDGVEMVWEANTYELIPPSQV